MNKMYKSKLFIILLILYITINSGSVISTTSNISIYLDLMFAIIFTLPVIVEMSKDKLSLVHYFFILITVFTMVTFTIYQFTPIGAYLGIVFKSIVAFGIVTTYKFKKMVNFFINYVFILAVLSLFAYYIIFPGIVKIDFNIVYNLNDVPYFTSFPFYRLVWAPSRNLGIFWEPGVFATYLIIAIVFIITFVKIRLKEIIYLLTIIIAVFTTESSAGYGLLYLVVLMWLVLIMFRKKGYTRYIIFTVIVAPFILLITVYPFIVQALGLSNIDAIQKLLPSEIVNQSRYLAIIHNLDIFSRMPIFGVGFTEATQLIEHVSDTSSTTYLISVFGLPGILYTLMFIIGTLKSPYFIKGTRSIVLIILLIIINKEPQYIILFSWILGYYLLHSISRTSLLINGHKNGTD